MLQIKTKRIFAIFSVFSLFFISLMALKLQAQAQTQEITRNNVLCYVPNQNLMCEEDTLQRLIDEAGNTPTRIELGITDTLLTKTLKIKAGQNIELVNYKDDPALGATISPITREDGFTDTLIHVESGATLVFSAQGKGSIEVRARGEWVPNGASTMLINGNFVLNDGKILGARGISGTENGAVVVSGENAKFVMNKGALTDNHRRQDQAGVDQYGAGNLLVTAGATFIMNGGEISKGKGGPTPYHYGDAGGINARNGATVEINGGKIVENTGWTGGILGMRWEDGKNLRDEINAKGAQAALAEAEKRRVKIKINGGVIESNIASFGGGGINLFGNASTIMNGGKITKNTSANGGGVNAMDLYVWGASDTRLEVPGEKKGFGGTAEEWAKYSPAEFILNDGEISHNTAVRTGGGVNIISNKVLLRGGNISHNDGGAKYQGQGGGIYIATHTYTAQLENVLITDNKAEFVGGGIWMCPTGSTEIYVTKGGAVFGNNATKYGNDLAHDNYGATGAYKTKLAQRMPGLGEAAYYLDGSDKGDPRFNAANPGPEQVYQGDVPESARDANKVYKTRLISEGLQQVSTDKAREGARLHTKLVISNNTSYRGGGIGTNGGVRIGYSDKELHVKKIWKDEKGGEIRDGLPSEIELQLLIKTDKGLEEVGAPVKVKPKADGSWSYTFKSLPAFYRGKDAVYSVKEKPIKGYKTLVEQKDNDVTITNTKMPTPPPDTPPTPEVPPTPGVPPTPEVPPVPSIPPTPEVPQVPRLVQSGAQIAALVIFATVCCAAGAGSLIYRRKKAQKEEKEFNSETR